MKLRLLGMWDLFMYFTRCLGLFHRNVRQDFSWPYHDAERIVCLRCGARGEP